MLATDRNDHEDGDQPEEEKYRIGQLVACPLDPAENAGLRWCGGGVRHDEILSLEFFCYAAPNTGSTAGLYPCPRIPHLGRYD